jgi:glycosyltransferase involved in cell wall biosynthesis
MTNTKEDRDMQTPTVSFVVPCYKLAHLLTECVDSILAQTYQDFEILILNDRSPDNTDEVARSFTDPRIVYISNPENLGNLKNYNKGINLSRGKYVWLISADDYLRKPYVLEKYVRLMDSNDNIGYTFCSGFSVMNGVEGELLGAYGKDDRVINGHVFLRGLFHHNLVLAASALVRRECYQKISVFPLESSWGGIPVDMGWLGDWYLWCVFALNYDVGYFAEPMVCYRQHDLSMSNIITQREIVRACADSDIGMLWIIREKAIELGLNKVAKECLAAIGDEYSRQGASKHFRSSVYSMDSEHFEYSVRRSTSSKKEQRWIRSRFYDGVGNRHQSLGEKVSARQAYLTSLRNNPWQIPIYGKLFLLLLGKPGEEIRRRIRHFREMAVGASSH